MEKIIKIVEILFEINKQGDTKKKIGLFKAIIRISESEIKKIESKKI